MQAFIVETLKNELGRGERSYILSPEQLISFKIPHLVPKKQKMFAHLLTKRSRKIKLKTNLPSEMIV